MFLSDNVFIFIKSETRTVSAARRLYLIYVDPELEICKIWPGFDILIRLCNNANVIC
jgi:hypothetical protein